MTLALRGSPRQLLGIIGRIRRQHDIADLDLKLIAGT
ncbi:hypothetical protein ACVWW6_008844 [Bradyrhizobium sp. USDA 3311]